MKKRGQSFDRVEDVNIKTFKHVETKEKQLPPTIADIYQELLPDDLNNKSEVGEIKQFIKSSLKRIKTHDYSYVPDQETIQQEKQFSRAGVENFDKSQLHHVDVVEKTSLPTAADLRAELLPDFLPTRPELKKLQQFVRSYLKHVETNEKIVLPTFEDILQEEKESMSEVKGFKKSKLKHTFSVEKNPLPDMSTLWSEMVPDYISSKPELIELLKFAHTDLKHVEPNIKYKLPTAEDIKTEATDCRAEVKNFPKHSLKRVKTEERDTVPTLADLCAEMLPDYVPPKPELQALNKFVKSSLKHVNTIEKVFNPTYEDLKEDKKAIIR